MITATKLSELSLWADLYIFGRATAQEVSSWPVTAETQVRSHGSLHGWQRVNGRLYLKCDCTRTETRFRLSVKRTSPFKSAEASVQSTTGSRVVRISGSNDGYTMFRGSVKSTGYPLHLPVSPSLSLPCVTVCHHISAGLYSFLFEYLVFACEYQSTGTAYSHLIHMPSTLYYFCNRLLCSSYPPTKCLMKGFQCSV
jgi:hypothetical protein